MEQKSCYIITDYDLKAPKSQMVPDFIFNSTTSQYEMNKFKILIELENLKPF